MRILVAIVIVLGALFLQIAQWLDAAKPSAPRLGEHLSPPHLEQPIEASGTSEFLPPAD